MIGKIKFIIGVITLIFIFLPLGSCERKAVESYSAVVIEDSLSSKPEMKDSASQKHILSHSEPDYLIPIKVFEFNKPSTWLMVIIFIWPLLLLATKIYLIKAKWQKLTLSTLELLFSGFSIYFIYSLLYQLWYEPTKWGYLAFVVVVSYFIVLLYELFSPYFLLRLKKI